MNNAITDTRTVSRTNDGRRQGVEHLISTPFVE